MKPETVKKGRPPVLTRKGEAKAMRLRDKGWTYQRIADLLGVGIATVHRATNALNGKGEK